LSDLLKGVMKKVCGWIAVIAGSALMSQAQSTLLYQTKFERAEGYDPALELAGQGGWAIEGTGGNGILENFFEGEGQQAFIGFAPPTAGSITTVWRPIGFTPAPAASVVHFSVTMQVVPSTAGGDDDFRWAVYNRDGKRLFGLSFETGSQEIWFQNEDLVFRSTGWSFDYEGIYELHIWMDFARNSWTALLNDIVLANGQYISTISTTALNLGDVDAVWFINNPNGVGNNYMIFDNYRLTSESLSSIPAIMEPLERTPEGYFQFLIHGQPDVRYSVEVTTDFQSWDSLGEFTDPDGTFLFEDDTATPYSTGFYRLRELP
jgi:hypothetical protein